jgi:hypothetical protein
MGELSMFDDFTPIDSEPLSEQSSPSGNLKLVVAIDKFARNIVGYEIALIPDSYLNVITKFYDQINPRDDDL